MKQLIYELNGKKYLLVERLITERTSPDVEEKCEALGCIFQGIKEVNQGGFFDKAYSIVRILVPEEKVQEFNDQDWSI